jgi:hypothetical protein
MITELDIYRSARVLIDQHGEDAPIWAAQPGWQTALAQDPEGCRGSAVQGPAARRDGAVGMARALGTAVRDRRPKPPLCS